ncbi:MAG: hypothetical protein COA44_14125 [Arcobacter sp.]|nr:MAG: hypothetical protein COA44_14125 [Arcobacter sp.]
MKIIILLSLPFILFASSETLYTGETLSTHDRMFLHRSSNHRPSIRMKDKRKVHKIHKVDEKQAKIITKEETKEEVAFLRLKKHGEYLVYYISTEHYALIINALDGTIIKKELK